MNGAITRVNESLSPYARALAERSHFTLAFPEPVEAEFLADYRRTSLPFFRLFLSLGVGINVIFALWDYLMFPDVVHGFWIVRLLIVSPYVCIAIASTFLPTFKPYWQSIATSAVIVTQSEFFVMMVLAPADRAHLYFYPATMYILSYASTTLKLRFINALFVDIYAVAGYQIVALVFCHFPKYGLMNGNFFMVGLGATGALAAYMLELYARRDFVQRRTNEELLKIVEQEKALATQANAAKTSFLAAASHDLRQPLHTIGLLVDVLHDRATASDLKDLSNRIRSAVVAMEQLFKGLLDISKLDAGMIKPAASSFPLKNVFDAVRVQFAPIAEQEHLRLRVRDTKVWVHSDPVILERILGNLISNAIKYSVHRGVLLGCRRRAHIAQISVWDQGIGIPQKDLDRIFEEFFQLGNPERDRTKGLGLGLSIVRRSARLLGHHICVTSWPDKGSCFSIDVPIGARGASIGYREERPGLQSDLICGCFVLVIDDEENVRIATQTTLESWGCHVVCGASAVDAIRALHEHLRTPDLIICDYRLREGMNGLDAIDAVRASIGESPPALIITGDIGAQDISAIAQRGIPVAHKPLTGSRLKELISGLLAT